MIFINVSGLLVVVLIVWWFWLYRRQEISPQNGKWVVVVENGVYQPARILLKANTTHELTFIRKDESPCAETVVFPQLELSETLPINIPRTVRIPATSPGEMEFHCQMKMYQGVLIIEE